MASQQPDVRPKTIKKNPIKAKTRLRTEIEAEKARLRTKIDALTFTCRACNGGGNTLLFPCCHISLCEICYVKYKKCPMCKVKILATKQVFFV